MIYVAHTRLIFVALLFLVKTSPSEGNVSWKYGGKKDSIQNGGMKSLNNDDSWNIENRNDPNISNPDMNKKFGSLSIQTKDCVNQSAISPPAYQHTANKSPQKTSPKVSMQQTAQTSAINMKKSPMKQADYSDMPPLEPAVVDEMPSLEPSIVEEMPLLEQSVHEYSDGLTRVWVGNFPYYETEVTMQYVQKKKKKESTIKFVFNHSFHKKNSFDFRPYNRQHTDDTLKQVYSQTLLRGYKEFSKHDIRLERIKFPCKITHKHIY